MTAGQISVIVCTYNREKFIGKALECLNSQTLAKSAFEVLVIDNSSTDRTAEICHRFIAEHPGLTIRYFLEESKGLSFARNRGLREAAYPILTYIDDDAEAVPGFLEAIGRFAESNPAAAGIGGRVIPKYSESEEPSWMNSYLNGFVGKVDYGDEVRPYRPPMKYPAGCNMTYKASVLKEVGGFNNQLTFRSDDKHMYYLVSGVSHEIYYVPAATVYHNIDRDRLGFSNFRKLFLKTGNEEKIRVRLEEGPMGWWKKLLEYKLKLGASLFIYLGFILRGKGIKGRYVFYSQWFTLRGFLQKQVFVR